MSTKQIQVQGSTILVSNTGVISTKDGTPLKVYYNGGGYPGIVIPGQHFKSVHFLVATAFVSGYFEGATVNHKNGNKEDNYAENLEWVSVSENLNHKHQVLDKGVGEDHGNAIVSDDIVGEIVQRYRTEDISLTQLGQEYGIPPRAIGKWVRGERRSLRTGITTPIPNNYRLTKDEKKNILLLYEEGVQVREIARITGRSLNRVCLVTSEAGLKRRPRLTEENIADIHSLADLGHSNSVIAEQIGCSSETVRIRLLARKDTLEI